MKLQFIIALNLLLCCVLCDDKSDNEKRTLSVTLNPGCPDQIGTECEGLTFVHVQAKSADNTIHYIWDFSGSPSFLLARTNNDAKLYVGWDDFMRGLPNSVNFSSPPELIFSSVIKSIHVFNDPADRADVNDKSVTDVTTIDPHNFSWERKNLTNDNSQITLVMSSNVGSNGSFAVKVRDWNFLLIATCS